MPRKPANEAASEPSAVADFEASLDALEQLVGKMEAGGMSLEESLAAGLEKAARAIDSGAAATVLERWAALTTELAAHH